MNYLPTGRALIDPVKALEEAGIKEEMKVADLGVGAVGHFLFPTSDLVGSKGEVYGVDILKSVLQANENRAKLAGKKDNIHYVWGDIDRVGGTRLPDHSMDMALVVNVLHLAKDGGLLEEVQRILHTGGTLLVVDWKPAGTHLGPSPDRRLTKDEAKALLERSGMKLTKEFEAGSSHYGLVATKL